MAQNTASFAIVSTRKANTRGRTARRYRTATALMGGLAATILLATPALAQAQGGAGGSGGFGDGGTGGEAGQAGGRSSCVIVSVAECDVAGGAAGTAPGGNGGTGSTGVAGPGGGGGGGADGSPAAPIGGAGGSGGNGDSGNYSNGGGGGGGGGNGLILSGPPLINSGIVAGGNGGNGGSGSPSFFSGSPGTGGDGGEGGTGIVASAGGEIHNLSTGSIAGGVGGLGGAGSPGGGAGASGAGGTGIRGADLSIYNDGSIAGGLSGDGLTRAYALHVTGGVNRLTLSAGGSVTGGIQLDMGSLLTFDVSAPQTLDNVISGAGSIAKAGTGTLILTGASSYSGSTTLDGGTLQIDDPASIGSGAITLNTGGLRTTFDGALANNLFWENGATGALAAATGTTLTLSGTLNVYGENTVVQFGTAIDAGTIIGAFFTGSSDGSALQRLIIGGGTFRAGTGLMSLSMGNFEAVQIDSGATLDINGVQPTTTLNDLEGGGTLLNDGATTIITSGNFAGTITGTQALEKTSTGRLILTGDSDHSGGTLVAGGTLQIGAGGSGATSGTLTGNISVSTGASLVFARSDAYTVAGQIDGDGSVGQAGLGVLTLTGANSYTGGTVITAGLINFSDPGNLGLGGITLDGGGLQWDAGNTADISARLGVIGAGGGVFDTNGNDVTLATSLSGGGLTKIGGGILTLSGNNSFNGLVTIGNGTLLQNNATALHGAGIVLDGGTLDLGSYDLPFVQGLGITGTGTIESSGGGGLTTVSGEETVFGSNGGSISAAVGLTVASGSTLTMLGNNLLTGGILVDGKLVIGETGATGGAGNMIATIGSVISFADGVDNSSVILIASNSTQLEVLGTDVATQSGEIGEDQPGRGFEKIGTGTLILTAVNSYSGDTLISGGLINFIDGDSFGSGTVTLNGGGLQWASGSSFDISARLNPIGIDGGTFDTNGNDVSLVSSLTGTGGITKTGAGTLFLDGSNSYGGNTTVLAGTLGLSLDDSASTGTILLGNGTTLLNATCGCSLLTIGNAISVAGTATIDSNGGEFLFTGDLTGGNLVFDDNTFPSGVTTLTGNNSYGDTSVGAFATLVIGDGGTNGTLGTGTVTTDGILAFNRSDDVTLSTAIGGSGLLGQFGTGTLILTGSNTYTGGTDIEDGTVQVGTGGTVGALGTGTIDNYGTLVFNRSDDISVADDIQGIGQITKLGAGTLTLSGFNGNFLGTLSILDGTVAVTQTALGSGEIEIDNGAELHALDDVYGLGMTVLSGGGTIDTGTHFLGLLGDVDFQGELTKTGSGILVLVNAFGSSTGAGGINVTEGTLALVQDGVAGTGIIKLADGTTLQNASCGCSELNVDNAIQIAIGGVGTIDGNDADMNLNGAISGGDVHFINSYTPPLYGSRIALNGANSYRDSLIGPNVALIVRDGTLGTGNVVFDAVPSDPATPAALVFQNSADYSYGGRIIGAGIVSVEADAAAMVTLTGSNTASDNFTGSVEVMSGRLVINGDFGDVTGNTASLFLDDSCFCGGGPTAALGGSGTFHGSVTLDNAVLAPGNSPGTLAIAGNLTLGTGTILNYELGAPGTVGGASNDLVNVAGNLTLNGTLNTIASGAGYGPGYYRLFNYGGTLTDNEIVVGSIAGGLDAQVLTDIGGQVNVRLGGAQIIQYWDGGDTTGSSATAGGSGGSGIWNALSTNWTAPAGFAINDSWRGQAGVFAGAAGGTVTIDGALAFEKLSFETDGYQLRPNDSSAQLATTAGFSIIDVSAGITADIGVSINGTAGLTKDGTGTLLLSAANGYAGPTDIAAGTLRMRDANAISSQSDVSVSASALLDIAGYNASFNSLSGTGDVTLGAGGTLLVGANNGVSLFGGSLTSAGDGTGRVTKIGTGTFTLSGSIALTSVPGGATALEVAVGDFLVTGSGTVTADTVTLQAPATFSNAGTVTAGMFQNSGTLINTGTIATSVVLQSSGSFINDGTVTGTVQSSGSFSNNATGAVDLLQVNGGTATNAGTANFVTNSSSFASTGIINGGFNNLGTAQLEGQLNAALINGSSATVTLTGAVTGITEYQAADGSTFDLAGFNTQVGGLVDIGTPSTATIQLGTATLTLGGTAPGATFNGVISGSGGLIKTGNEIQILTGANNYTGATAVNQGELALGAAGTLTSDVTIASGATFTNAGTVTGLTTNSGSLAVTGILDSTGPIALINNAGGQVVAQGQINGAVQSNGSFRNTGALTGITGFSQGATGQLTLNAGLELGSLAGAGNVDLGAYALTVGANGASTVFNGVITGSGGLTKTGTGTLTLTGANSYTGQTLVSGGALLITSTGTIAGAVVNNANFASSGILSDGLTNNGTATLSGTANGLVSNQAGSITLSGNLVGTGRFSQSSGASFNLANNNAAFGSLSESGTVALGSGRLTVGGDESTTIFTGVITGTGGITKNGEGRLTLSGVSTYGGATVINNGTLLLAEGGAIGGGAVVNGSFLEFDGTTDRTFGNAVSGSGILVKSGSNVLTLTGLNSYDGGTNVNAGTVAFDNGQALGSGTIRLASATGVRNVQTGAPVTLANNITIAAGTLATISGVGGSSTTLNGEINDGYVRFAVSGGGTASFTLGSTNQYEGTMIGAGATVNVTGGTLGSGGVALEAAGSTLNFANTANYTYAGVITGNGHIGVNTGAGVAVTLSGSNYAGQDFTGTVSLDSGKLVLNGDFGDLTANSASLTLNGGSLGGSGTFHGDMTIGAGTLSPGNSPGTLNIAGNLNLGAATILNFELTQPGAVGGGVNDLINVGGNLKLDGTLNVTALAGFGEGYYRLFNYGGTLTDNGLIMGSLPAGFTSTLLTNIGGQVNLLFASSPQAIQYWDGTDLTGSSTATGGNGGAGVWSGTNTNWTAPTDYGVNDSWRGQVAIFGGSAGGAVTVQGVRAFQELRFTTDGYAIGGATAADGLATTGGFSVVDVSGGLGATINTVISGTGGLTKTGTGTLSLGGVNSYTGITTVSGGTLMLTAGGSLAGAVQNDAMFNNAGTVAGLVTNTGTLVSTGTLGGGLSNSGGASLAGTLTGAVANSGTITLTGATAGIGAVTQSGSGTFNLAGVSTSFGSLAGAGTVALGGATLTIGSDNSSTSFGGVISGSGGLTKAGTGVFTLTGANSYTGLTTASVGTLQLSATGEIAGAVRNDATFNNAGWVDGLVTNTGTLASIGTLHGGLNNSGTASISGTLTGGVSNSGTIGLIGSTSGIGAVTQTAGGSIALNGFDTSFGSLAGAGSVDNGGATLTLGSGNGGASFGGVISGSGGLTKVGTGTQTLTGANTYTGLTLVSAGTLAIGASGSIAGAVRNQATFTNAGTVIGPVQNDATLTSTGNLAGGLINNGTASLAGTVGTGLANNGAVNFTGAATVAVLQQNATGTFNLAGFGVSLGALTGSGAITLGTGALSVGSAGGNASFAGTISGAGSLTKTGTGTLVLTGAATQTGGTTISGGMLQIGAGGTTGSLSGAIVNNGLLAINRSDAVTLANIMSGSGGFVQAGTGTTTLIGANSYTGGTRVATGRLRGDTTSLQGDIRIDSALEFAQTGAGTYAGSLSGAGLLEKTGTGSLNFTGNSATFTGATNVIAGQMAINGLLSRSTVTVSNGATVGGTGTVGGLVVQSGGTVAPGNSVGTFNVAGNVLFQAGSLFAAEVQGNSSDRIQATGTAQLNGTLQVIALGGNYGINSAFVLLHADGGLNGTFATTNLASFGLAYRAKIIYTANEVQLFLAPNQLSAILGTGVPLTYNQTSTIGRIDAAVITGGYDPVALSALYSLAPTAIPAALDQLSGEIYADATRATLEDERVVREAVIGRLAEAADLGVSGNGAWGQVIGSWGSVSSDGNAAGYDVNRAGMLMGLDAGSATEEGSWRAGVMGHYTRITVPADARGSRATIDRTGGGFYAGAAMNGWRVRVGASLSLLDLKARRTIAIPGLATSERGKKQGVMLQTFGELSYRIEAGKNAFVEPYLAGSASRVTFGRFAERSGPAALMVGGQKSVLGIAELGLRGETALVGGGDKGSVRLGGNIGLRTAFGDRVVDPVIALAAAPSQAFNVRSAEIDRFAAAANLNLTVDVSDTLSLRVGYSGVLASGAREHGGRATLSLKF
ncbi:autotransporter-associated beta strand repeat-containing protein [Sphingomonas sp. R-74633]|uniref:autotransporter-associated beta strand repeat-containing protein n=1 Tax=Sphingomonas sp. R-74633 TaxID=2751188 RepID=UPI0015D30CB8|nr:autotransporter-associated beta strand repeat-containing protein [Sphingomonas sp. R-74633]NYT39696.1 autotransporter-associated beta strand repeat-containing protein [Sphingomonas sp. R-74633]